MWSDSARLRKGEGSRLHDQCSMNATIAPASDDALRFGRRLTSRRRSRAGSAISATSGACRRRRSRPISATSASSSAFLDRASGRRAVARRSRQACAAGRARLHGGAARGGHRQPLADARARRRALVRAFSGAQRQGQGRRARRGARAEDAEDPAEAARRRRGQAPDRRRSARRRRARALGAGARRRRAGAALRLRAAHLRSARAEARRVPRPARAMRSRSPARATSSAWCRCCRRCSS